MALNSTIVAISTGSSGAISIIRISGDDSLKICERIFKAKNLKPLTQYKGFSLVYGFIMADEEVIDDVLISLFRAPNSYTGEDMVEISCHASPYIQSKIIELLLSNGASMAQGGDFTMRAYANGKMDLVQAEAVADVIASSSEASHRIAINQIRGGYTREFSLLRTELINLMSLIELELDFSEEDVEFADRKKLISLVTHTHLKVSNLTNSFQQGNAIKNGVPVVIVGRPNVGKSTLLNTLLNEDRVMVSPIAGTTRDVIEEIITLGGIEFRFIDTAGIHQTEDYLETLGIERTIKSIKKASLILLLIEVGHTVEEVAESISGFELEDWQSLIILRNKIDLGLSEICEFENRVGYRCFDISAKENIGIDSVINYLSQKYALRDSSDILISNMRHYELLQKAGESLQMVLDGISGGIPTDFLAQDLRTALHHIGSLTGEISTDDILGNIFKNFCIGK